MSLKGVVVYVYAFDLAYDMKRQPLETLLGQPVREAALAPGVRAPKHLFFYRPRFVSLPPEQRQTSQGDVQIHRSVKIFGVGAMSVQARVPFEVDRLDQLVTYHELAFGGKTLEQDVRDLAERVRAELAPLCIRPVESLPYSEAYTVFCLDRVPEGGSAPTLSAGQWLDANRRAIAGLLNQEPDAADLSEQEANESTGLAFSYHERDLVVVDWDAALVIGNDETLNDVVHIMELANVQLEEMEEYDRLLDATLQLAYRDLAGRPSHHRRRIRRELREIRVDMARLSDELSNITKFFGDWHLARIYQALSQRFHLADWHRTVEEKLSTLGELYEILQQERTNLWMVVLELTIVLLFIFDVALLLIGLG